MVGCIFIMSMDVWAGIAIFTYYRTQRGHCIKLVHVAMNLYRLYFGYSAPYKRDSA